MIIDLARPRSPGPGDRVIATTHDIIRAGLYAAAIWRFPGRRRVQWVGYAYAFATIALTAPFFPRTLGTGYSFTTRLPEGLPPPLLGRLMLGAMAFAAAGITITVLAVLFGRPLARLESRRLSSSAACCCHAGNRQPRTDSHLESPCARAAEFRFRRLQFWLQFTLAQRRSLTSKGGPD